MAATGWTWSTTIGLTVLGLVWGSVEACRSGPDRERESHRRPVHTEVTTGPPQGRLPPKVHGRDALIRELAGLASQPDGLVHVVCGLGGVGKTTVAAKVSERVAASGGMVWWINAGDDASLTASLTSLLVQLGAAPFEYDRVTAASEGQSVADLVWRYLEIDCGWLLVIDNADEPQLLAGSGGWPCDGSGIVRGSRQGLVLVTSRVRAAEVWGTHVARHELSVLSSRSGARVLRDVTGPSAGTLEEAARLASRLGGLPLALRAAALYMSSDIAKVDGATTYTSYQQALEFRFVTALARRDDCDRPRDTIAATWELSLNALHNRGIPHARTIMRLLGGFEAAPIPVQLLDPEIIARRLVRTRAPMALGELRRWRSFRSFGLPGDRRNNQSIHRQAVEGLCQMAMLEVEGARDQRCGPTCFTAHRLIFEVNRMFLDADPKLRRRVAITAVELIASGVDVRDPEEPAGSHWLATLAPHVARMLDVAEVLRLPRKTGRRLAKASIGVIRAVYIIGDYYGSYSLAGRAYLYCFGFLGLAHPVTLAVQHGLAAGMIALGRYEEAESELYKLLRLRSRVLGDHHLDTLRTRHNLAYALSGRALFDKAIKEYDSVLRWRRRLCGDEHPSTLRTAICLARTLADAGQHQAAQQMFSDLLYPCNMILGEEHPETLDVRQGLAQGLLRKGCFEDAASEYQSVLSLREQVLGAHHPDSLVTRRMRAQALVALGNKEDATSELQQILDLSTRILGSHHPDSILTSNLLHGLLSRSE